ncbi:MAG TPA: PilZ domain-containing protein [Polyangiaceae bacterium]|nr:PilZ domain-containing protein [Polyangiaceae bacterium]
MSDPVSAARAARENLARGLGALQSPGVPPHLIAVAEPVAQAMSALHRIEASHGAAAAEAGAAALAATRHALATLQQSSGQHPAVDHALEAIAGSLGLIHQLSQAAQAAGTSAGNPGQGFPPPAPQPAAYAPNAAQPPPQAWQPQAAPAPAYVPPAPYPAPAAAQYPPLATPGDPAPGAPAAAPYQAPAAPAAAPYQAPAAAAPGFQQPQPARAPAPAPGAPPPVPHVPPGTLRLEAELGAHSGTNFYKGLSGNDVIDSGGIFIATYQIPPIGQNLSLRVSMPGGYEFEALGVVRWTRDTADGGDGKPGFGAQFTQITPEGRQLVYRYVRNREPLFHDDL